MKKVAPIKTLKTMVKLVLFFPKIKGLNLRAIGVKVGATFSRKYGSQKQPVV